MDPTNQNRRDFFRRTIVGLAALPLFAGCRGDTFAQRSDNEILRKIRANAIPNDGEWNGAKDAPADVSWRTNLVSADERANTLSISGTVFSTDGTAPAANALIYIYHTDSDGLYGRNGQHRHGRFRGWMLTGPNGQYEFSTILPAPYPVRRFAAHIHTTITTEGLKEDWIDSYLFEGDPLISTRERADAGKKGGFQPIVKLEKNSAGIWCGRRDIRLWSA